MTFTYDPIVVINLVLTSVIMVLGIWGYRRSGRLTEMLVGGAFGLFAASHLLVLFGVNSNDLLIITVRIAAYLVVIFAMVRVAAGQTYG